MKLLFYFCTAKTQARWDGVSYVNKYEQTHFFCCWCRSYSQGCCEL